MYTPAGITLDDTPNLKAWVKRISERPAVKKGVAVPSEGFAAKANSIAADPLADADAKKSYEEALSKVKSAREALA